MTLRRTYSIKKNMGRKFGDWRCIFSISDQLRFYSILTSLKQPLEINPIQPVYSVTQSYANSLLGDVVLDGFNVVCKNEDNILDQIYIKQMCSDFYYEDLKF